MSAENNTSNSILNPQSDMCMAVVIESDDTSMVNLNAEDVYAFDFAETITKDDLIEIVQTSQKHLELLSNEIREKERHICIMSQQIYEMQAQLESVTSERDSLLSKEVSDAKDSVNDSVNDGCNSNTFSIDDCNVPKPKRKRIRKINPKPTNSTSSPRGLIPVLPRSDDNFTNRSNFTTDTSYLDNAETSQQDILVRPVTVYNIVESLKEYVCVHEFPYSDCCVEGCGAAMSTSAEIEEHYKSIHSLGTIVSITPKRTKRCDECEKVFLNGADLKLHKKWHHPVYVDLDAKKAAIQLVAVLDNYGQPLLPVGGPTPKSSALTIDIIRDQNSQDTDQSVGFTVQQKGLVVNMQRKFQCYYCESKFGVKEFCEAHIRSKHFGISRPFYCKTCGRNLTSRKTYQTHMEIHTTGKRPTYSCQVCSRRFVSHTNLRRHQLAHTNERPHLCCICGLAFLQKGSLDNHMRIHGYRDALMCAYCCRGYRSKVKLKEHIELKHVDNQIYQCCVCSQVSPDEISLQQHFQIHKTVNREKPFGCQFCPFTTYFIRDLSCHLDAHKRGVARHEKKSRSGVNRQSFGPFICKFCNKRCIGRDILDLHEVKHTGIKKYKCESCGKEFSMQPLLKRHIDNKHVGVRFPCKMCGKQLTEPGNMKRHIEEVHNKARPFFCKTCNQHFSQKASLRAHMNTAAHKLQAERNQHVIVIKEPLSADDVCSGQMSVPQATMDKLVFGDSAITLEQNGQEFTILQTMLYNDPPKQV